MRKFLQKNLDMVSASLYAFGSGSRAVEGIFMQHVLASYQRGFAGESVFYYGFYFYGFSTACGRECAA